MKHSALAVLLVAATGAAAAANLPDPDHFFAAMAIEAKPGQQQRFVAGDNIDGYYEGFTHSYDKGAGYVMRAGTWFQNYVSYVGTNANDRTHAREFVLPWGHRVVYPHGVSEELALLSHAHALALRVAAPRATDLALQPLLTPDATVSAHLQEERPDERSAVIAFAHGFMALASDVPFAVEDALLIRASGPQTSFTLVAAFAPTAQAALEQARAFAGRDPFADERALVYADLTRSYLETSDPAYNQALNWAKAASRTFVVDEFGAGIWAGLPWFRDNWGRDTFISLPGTLLVSGQFERAKAVLANFARFQNLTAQDRNYGRIPNRVSADTAIIYNTVDGTPWMLREAVEYIHYTGDVAFATQMFQLAVPYFDGAIANYMDGQALLTHDDADTWMDARIDGGLAWSPRGSRAVEIQALWYTALEDGAWLADQAGDHARATRWRALAAQARTSFRTLFWDGRTMADRIRADGSRDMRVRPNQLLAVTLPPDDLLPLDVQAQVTRNAVSALAYPYGVASLSQDDPAFHPRHENPQYHHKDAAYHNGTVWGWNAGFTVTALDKFGYQDLAWDLTRNLGDQILHLGTLGNMSELLDALPPVKPSGTWAQAWSVAEYARNAYQDYLGFRPDLPADTLHFTPALPAGWKFFHARLPFGQDERLDVDFARGAWTLHLESTRARQLEFDYLNPDRSRTRVRFTLAPNSASVFLPGAHPTLDGKPLEATAAQPSFATVIGALKFATPKAYVPQAFPVLRGKDVLKGIIEQEGKPQTPPK